MSWKTPVVKGIAQFLASRKGIVHHLLRDEALLSEIANEPKVLDAILTRSRWNAPELPSKEKQCLNESLREWWKRLSSDVPGSDVLDTFKAKLKSGAISKADFLALLKERLKSGGLSAGDVLDRIKVEAIAQHVNFDDLLSCFSIEEVLSVFSPEELIKHIDFAGMANVVPAEELVKHIGAANLVKAIPANDPALQDHIIAQPKALSSFAGREEVIRSILLDEGLKDKFRFLNAQQIAARLPYVLPAAVLSYPRSGSNFLQSILQHSSGLRNRSIYSPLREGKEVILTVKSHAVTPDYLAEEYARLVVDPPWPPRIVLVQRDPRDVMISFYEYTQFNRGVTIPQEDFLDQTCYFYASAIDRELQRHSETGPLSVAEAFRKHIRTWFLERPDSVSCLTVRYEDLVEEPDAAFQRVFEYLNLDCPLAKSFLKVKVSQYSQDQRKRASASAWRENAEKYPVLMEQVRRTLAAEIEALGYPAE